MEEIIREFATKYPQIKAIACFDYEGYIVAKALNEDLNLEDISMMAAAMMTQSSAMGKSLKLKLLEDFTITSDTYKVLIKKAGELLMLIYYDRSFKQGLMNLEVKNKVEKIVKEVIVVVKSSSQRKSYLLLFPKETKILIDTKGLQSPLIGALTGFENANGEYSILLPCDTPLVSLEVVNLLFSKALEMDAAIPRWPNGYIEPLHAVYKTEPALEAARSAVNEGKLNFGIIYFRLRNVNPRNVIRVYEQFLALNPQLSPGTILLWIK